MGRRQKHQEEEIEDLDLSDLIARLPESDDVAGEGRVHHAGDDGRAAELLPGNLEVQYWAAVTLATSGRLAEALPIFREIVTRVYGDALVGSVPRFPREMEDRIDAYLAAPAEPEAAGPVAEHRLGAMDRERTID